MLTADRSTTLPCANWAPTEPAREIDSEPEALARSVGTDWLDFLGQYVGVIERSEADGPLSANLPSRLLAAAGRIRTPTGRRIACAMVTQLAQSLETAILPGDATPGTAGLGTADPTMTATGRFTLGGRPTNDARVKRALDYLHLRHSDAGCQLRELADQIKLSRPHLSRLILRETGLTFNQHLQFARMSTATALLKDGQSSVKEVAYRTGYLHVPSFVRQFRRHFGTTPGGFRRAAQS